jgi:exopolyphosphatase/guanosine-5'-triphosphate,3'-diphosphate pyrophosphatase
VRVAAVDIGTNTVRYLVGDVVDGDLRSLRYGREITRLGQGVDRDKRLHPDAVARTLAAIDRAVSAARQTGAEQIRVAGTSALRDAADRETFAEAVRDRTGQVLEVVSGEDEGRLSMLGATSGLPDGDYTVCDIGGGSTELSTEEASVSLDIGSVRLKERCLHDDPPTAGQIAEATAVIDDALGTVTSHVDGTLVGVAGTITTVAAVVMDLEVYDSVVVHHSRLSGSDVAECSDRLLRMRAADIAELGPLDAGRADIIGGGSLILRRVMERWGFAEVLVSERDILDGLVLDLAANR